MWWLDLTYYLLLMLLGFVCVAVTIVGLPGLWIFVLFAVLYAWVGHWAYLSWPGLLTIFILAVLSEVAEFIAGAAGSKQAGGSWLSMVGAIAGGLAGGILGTFVIPVPLVGSIIGAIVGSAIGAAGLEVFVERDWRKLSDVGIGAGKGRAWGILFKTGFGVAIWLFLLLASFPR